MPTSLKRCARFWAVTRTSSSGAGADWASATAGNCRAARIAVLNKVLRVFIIGVSSVLRAAASAAGIKLGKVETLDLLAARHRVAALAVREPGLDERIGDPDRERNRVDHGHIETGGQQFLAHTVRAAEKAGAAENDDVRCILLHGCDRFARERGLEGAEINPDAEHRNIDRTEGSVCLVESVAGHDLVDHGAQAIEHGDEAEAMPEHARDMHRRLARAHDGNADNLAAGLKARVAHAVDDDGVGAFTLDVHRAADRVGNADRFVELAFDGRGSLLDQALRDREIGPHERLHLFERADAFGDDRCDQFDAGLLHNASFSSGVKGSLSPNACGPNTASAAGVRMIGAALMPRTATRCPYLRPSVVIGSAVTASSTAMRSGTIVSTRSPSCTTRCSFWNWIVTWRPAQPPVPSITTLPSAQPPVVSRKKSTVLPSKRTRQCW